MKTLIVALLLASVMVGAVGAPVLAEEQTSAAEKRELFREGAKLWPLYCNTCHKAGAAAFQSVTISVAGPGGIPVHYGVNKDVLSSVFSINSIGGFYAIGGTRITFLDVLFVLALLGGFGLPALHLVVKFLSKRSAEQMHRDRREG